MKAKQPVPGGHKRDTTGRGSQLYPRVVAFSQVGLFALACLYTIYLIRPFLLPVILALLLAMVLFPLASALRRLTRCPAPAAGLIVLLTFCAVAGTGFYYLSYPASEYAEKLREENVLNRLRSVFSPITDLHNEIKDVAGEVETLTENTPEQSSAAGAEETPGANTPDLSDTSPQGQPEGAETNRASGVTVDIEGSDMQVSESEDSVQVSTPAPPVQVQIREDRVEAVYTFAQQFFLHLVLTLVISFFLLAFGNQMLHPLAKNEVAQSMIENISRDVSQYLLTVTTINVGLGLSVGLATWLLGLPNPLLWAAMAALLNFIPYIGAVIGTAVMFVVAATNSDSATLLIAAPLSYYALTAIEGNFITPSIIGKRFEINPAVVFLWVVAWGALWGVAGMLIGLPLLMVVRIVVEKVPTLSTLNRMISTPESETSSA